MKGSIDRILGRIALFCIFVVSLFLIAEAIFSRISGKVDVYNDPQTKVIKPYVMFGGVPYGNVVGWKEPLNGLGYRGPLPENDKSPGEYRIFVLGGSTVMAGTPPIPELLEDIFHLNGHKNVRVFNFGCMSSGSGQSLARILYEVYDLQPDLIIMYEGGNDIMDRYFFGDPRPGYPYNFVVYEKNPLLMANNTTQSLFSLLALRSAIVRAVALDFISKRTLQIEQLRKSTGFGSEEWKSKIVQSYIGNIKKGAKLSAAVDAKFMAVFQPMLCTKRSLAGEEKAYLTKEAQDYCLEMVHRVRKEMNEHQSLGLPVRDYSALFDANEEKVFGDYIHFENSSYSQAVAGRMYQDILELYFAGKPGP